MRIQKQPPRSKAHTTVLIHKSINLNNPFFDEQKRQQTPKKSREFCAANILKNYGRHPPVVVVRRRRRRRRHRQKLDFFILDFSFWIF